MGMRRRSAKVMLEALLYDATQMLQKDVSPKTVHEFLSHKLDKDFKGSTWWKVDWSGSRNYSVTATVKHKLCPACNNATVNEEGICLTCEAKCSTEDLITVNTMREELENE